MLTTFYVLLSEKNGIFSCVCSGEEALSFISLLEAQSKIKTLYYKLDDMSYKYFYLHLGGNIKGEFPSLRTEFTEEEYKTLGRYNLDYINKLSKMELKYEC